MLSESMRKLGFWGLDYLKGGKVKKHYDDISDKLHGKKDPLNIMTDLLKHVQSNVPYYEEIRGNQLSDFPVINKKIIMENYENFQSRTYENSKLHWVSTSGSTGTPFKASQNSEKRNRTIADLLYFHNSNGWNLGVRYIFLRAWTSSYQISKLKLFMQNFIAADVVKLDDELKEDLRIKLKEDTKIKVILGYASALDNFVNFLENKGDSYGMFNIEKIFTCSDNLSDLTKAKLEKMFNCKVINRYSNEELGVLACTSSISNTFELNTASYYFELLQIDSNEPVGPGEIGRLVVTDLYNHSMPFIRYDTGDLAISDDINRKQIKTLSSLEGRVADSIIGENGKIISAAIVNNYLNEFYKIKQYQLIQQDKNNYLFKVVCDRNDYNEENLLKTCKIILGNLSNINIEYVNEIPLEKTGKYKTIVNQHN